MFAATRTKTLRDHRYIDCVLSGGRMFYMVRNGFNIGLEAFHTKEEALEYINSQQGGG